MKVGWMGDVEGCVGVGGGLAGRWRLVLEQEHGVMIPYSK